MERLYLTQDQEKKLLEICEDLFPEYSEVYITNGILRDYIFFVKDGKEERFLWLVICLFELPKRIAENSKSVLPESTQYRIYESMSKRILNIHPTYKNVEPKHPVDYLYEEFKKI